MFRCLFLLFEQFEAQQKSLLPIWAKTDPGKKDTTVDSCKQIFTRAFATCPQHEIFMNFYPKEIGSKIYSTLPGNQSIPLQFTPQAAPRSFSQLHGYPEVRSLIAAYRANYDRLKSTKSSHGKKNVWVFHNG